MLLLARCQGGDNSKVLPGSTVELSQPGNLPNFENVLAASAPIEADDEPGDSSPSKDPPSPPDIGCTVPPVFKPSDPKRGRGVIFDMEDYCRDAVSLYKRITGQERLRKATTPFVPEGSLPAADDAVRGDLYENACRVLMKALWLARSARPDIQKPICDLATHIKVWSRNDDKRLYRLIAYLEHSVDFHLIGQIQDLSLIHI